MQQRLLLPDIQYCQGDCLLCQEKRRVLREITAIDYAIRQLETDISCQEKRILREIAAIKDAIRQIETGIHRYWPLIDEKDDKGDPLPGRLGHRIRSLSRPGTAGTSVVRGEDDVEVDRWDIKLLVTV